MQEIIGNILIQPKIYGDNGEEIALNLLLNLFKLFLKFHKNSNYSTIFERIRYIFHQDHGSNSFFSNHRYEDDEKKYNYSNFNSQFCSEFEKKNENTFNIGDEVDFMIDNNNILTSYYQSNSFLLNIRLILLHQKKNPNLSSGLSFGAGSRSRTYEGRSRQIYSLMRLTTSLSQRDFSILA